MIETRFKSFYQICKEMMEEDGIGYSEDSLKHFQADQQEHWESYSKKAPGTKKEAKTKLDKVAASQKKRIPYKTENGRYQIPEELAGIIKIHLRNFTLPIVKKLRKGLEEQVTFEEYEQLVKELEEHVENNIEDEGKRQEYLGLLYLQSGYYGKRAKHQVQTLSQTLTKTDIEFIYAEQNSAYINESDRAYLLHLYAQMMEENSKKWRNIVEIVGDLREQELEDLSEREYNGEISHETTFTDIHTMIERALKIHDSERRQEARKSQAPSEEQLKRAGKIIEDLIRQKQNSSETAD